MKLTVKVKLLPKLVEKQSLLKTMERFNDACNYISEVAFKNKQYGRVTLHRLTYYDVRDRFNLSAQFAVRAIGKVSESYRAEKKKLHKFKRYSAVIYDEKLLSFRNLSIASILTVDGRYKIPIIFGEYAKLGQHRILGQADLIFMKGKFFLCLVIDLSDGTSIEPTEYLGVDFGIVNLATDSTGETFRGDTVDAARQRFTKLKKRLQSRGTKSAKRHLKRLSGKERRFKRDNNHIIAKKLVRKAKGTLNAIALEDLKGFRATVGKAFRERFGKWSFDELRRFVEYKARIEGIPVVAIDPRNTSRTCSRCGHCEKANRVSQSEFTCRQCGFSTNADFNAAVNIAARAAVSRPIVSGRVGRKPTQSVTEAQAPLQVRLTLYW